MVRMRAYKELRRMEASGQRMFFEDDVVTAEAGAQPSARTVRDFMLHAVNHYPPFGPYHYAGALPIGAYGVEGTAIVMASYRWRTRPFVMPGRLSAFATLMAGAEGSAVPEPQ